MLFVAEGSERAARSVAPFATQYRALGSLPCELFLQRLDCHFLEKYDVVVAVVLQSDPAKTRPRPALRFEVKFAVRHRIAVFIIRDLNAVEHNNRARTIYGNV